MKTFPLDPLAQAYQGDHQPAANTAAVVNIAADAQEYWVIDSIEWSYDAAPTGGNLLVTIGGTTVFSVDITAAGPGHFDWSNAPRYTTGTGAGGGKPTLNEAVVVTLAAGGASVTGKVNVRYR